MKHIACAVAILAAIGTAKAGTYKFGPSDTTTGAGVFTFAPDISEIDIPQDTCSVFFSEWNGPFAGSQLSKPVELAVIRQTLPVEFGFDQTRVLEAKADLIGD